jgi:hypothetical protein
LERVRSALIGLLSADSTGPAGWTANDRLERLVEFGWVGLIVPAFTAAVTPAVTPSTIPSTTPSAWLIPYQRRKGKDGKQADDDECDNDCHFRSPPLRPVSRTEPGICPGSTRFSVDFADSDVAA